MYFSPNSERIVMKVCFSSSNQHFKRSSTYLHQRVCRAISALTFDTGETDPQVDLGVVAGALSVDNAEGLQQTGLLAVQEQSPPDGLLLVLLPAVQLNLHLKALKRDPHKKAGKR